MRRAIAGALVACCLLTHTASGDDGQVAQLLSETLRNAQKREELKGFRINVKVENGVVWMKGSVKTKLQREKALDLARRVEGVRLVVNDLKIEEGGETASSPASVPAPKTVAPATPPVAQPTPQPSVGVAAVGAGVQQNMLATHAAVQQAQMMAASGGQAMYPTGMAVPAAAALSMPQMAGPPGAMQVMIVPVPYPTPMAAPAQVRRSRNNPVPVGNRQVTRMVNYSEPAGCGPGGCVGGGGYGRPVYQGGGGYGGYGSGPVPEHSGYAQGGVVYDEPQMPNYAWPGYAAHPNYAALQYPKQYSAQAWPYIGPFYPYPQVPLGWRKVALEWDDGWWWLDFKSK